MNKKNFVILLAAQAVAVLIACVFLVKALVSDLDITLAPDSYVSDFATISDGDVIIRGDALPEGLEYPFMAMSTAYMDMPAGSYRAVIHYDTDADHYINLALDGPYHESSLGRITYSGDTKIYDFEITHPSRDVRLEFSFNGGEALTIHDMTISRTATRERRHLAEVVMICALLDLFLLLRKKKCFGDVVAITAMTALVFAPFMVGMIHSGHDFLFHLNRLEGLYEELAAGHFPVRLQSYWMDGYGYPVSIYYGDALLYVGALLRLLGFSVTDSYSGYVLVVDLLTVAIAYFSFGKITGDKKRSAIMAFAYATANYRLMDMYIRGAVGEYTAIAFFPLIAMALYGLYTEDVSDRRYMKNAVWLALGMTGLIQTHLLSTEMTVFVIIPIAIMLFKKTFRKQTILAYVLAVGIFILLNLSFIVPFIDYYIHVPVTVALPMGGYTRYIGGEGAFLGQYLSFFQDIYGWRSLVASERMSMTPGAVLILALIAAMVILWRGGFKDKKLVVFYLVTSLILLFVASDYFPWNRVGELGKFGDIFAAIQFPWRYLALAIVPMTLLLGEVLEAIGVCSTVSVDESGEGSDAKVSGNRISAATLVWGAMIFCLVAFSSSYLSSDAMLVEYYDASGLEVRNVMSGEYMLEGANRDSLRSGVIADGVTLADHPDRAGTTIRLDVAASETGGTLSMPIFNYRGYVAKTADGTRLDLGEGDNRTIVISVPAGYNGQITLSYREPVLWRIAEILTLAAWVGLIVFMIRSREKLMSDEGTRI